MPWLVRVENMYTNTLLKLVKPSSSVLLTCWTYFRYKIVSIRMQPMTTTIDRNNPTQTYYMKNALLTYNLKVAQK